MAFVGDFNKVLIILKNIYDNNRPLTNFFYSRGVDILKIDSYEDYTNIPLLKKSELVKLQLEKGPFAGLVEKRPVKLFQSPGPINNVKIEEFEHYRFYKALKKTGFDSSDIVINTFGYTVSPAGDMFDEACRYLNIPVFPLGPTTSDKAAEIVDTFSITAFIGTKTFLIKCAEICKKSTLKKAYLIAEKMSEDDRKYIKDRFNIEAYQGYGTAEVGLIGTEEIGSNYMGLDTDALFIEHLDPVTHTGIDLSEYGEAVITLLDYRLPFFRLATGDLVAYHGERLRGVFGRTDNSVKVRGVFVHFWQFEEFCSRLQVNCRLVVSNDIEKGKDTLSIITAVECASIKDLFKSKFGLSLDTVLVEPSVESGIEDKRENYKEE